MKQHPQKNKNETADDARGLIKGLSGISSQKWKHVAIDFSPKFIYSGHRRQLLQSASSMLLHERIQGLTLPRGPHAPRPTSCYI
jgi:hypothetical protein